MWLSSVLTLQDLSRPALFYAFAGSDLKHPLLGNRIDHVLRDSTRFVRAVEPVLWII